MSSIDDATPEEWNAASKAAINPHSDMWSPEQLELELEPKEKTTTERNEERKDNFEALQRVPSDKTLGEILKEVGNKLKLDKLLDDDDTFPTQEEIRGIPVYAEDFLNQGLKEMKDREKTYDCEGGERSMITTVEMFNSLTGSEITETEGWMFMTILKMVRSVQGEYRGDNYVDGAAYFALTGESARKKDRENK